MKVVQVKCPSCNTPIYSKQKDRLFYCDNCRTMHVRDGGVRKIDYEIAEFGNASEQGRTYVPFWRMYCNFAIRSKSVEGGYAFRLASWLKGADDSGSLFIYVPAGDFDAATFKQLAAGITMNRPKYKTRLDFSTVQRMPASMSREEAEELADFVVVTMEAEKPGVLQRLDYSLTINDSRIVYLPFIATQTGLMVAL
jgi:predicted RNA-binding Zn-ribbon protein involved in translation (DUF1610 family)